jgi:hypothetical protein
MTVQTHASAHLRALVERRGEFIGLRRKVTSGASRFQAWLIAV